MSAEETDAWGISDADYAVIGRLGVQHARVEGTLERIILVLTRLGGADAALLLDQALFARKLKILRGLVANRLEDQPAVLKEFGDLFKSLEDLNAERNVSVHGIWGRWATLAELARSSPEQPPASVVAAISRKRNDDRRVSIGRAEEIGRETEEAAARLAGLVMETWPEYRMMTLDEEAIFENLRRDLSLHQRPLT